MREFNDPKFTIDLHEPVIFVKTIFSDILTSKGKQKYFRNLKNFKISSHSFPLQELRSVEGSWKFVLFIMLRLISKSHP